MASAVLAKRYISAPGRPSTTNQNIGATTESFRFSASDSMTLSLTCTSLKSVTSRLTRKLRRLRPRASEPSGKPLRASSTACVSVRSIAQANAGLSTRPSSTAAGSTPAQLSGSSHAITLCSMPYAAAPTSNMPHSQANAPRAKAGKSAGSDSIAISPEASVRRLRDCTCSPAQAR